MSYSFRKNEKCLIMNDNTITALNSFKAMICFLDDYYNKTLSDDIGSLLGDIQLLEDGSNTWDPAAWNDWNLALEQKKLVSTMEGFNGIFNFLMSYYIRTSCSSNDIKLLLDDMRQVQNENAKSSSLWNTWEKCIQKVVTT